MSNNEFLNELQSNNFVFTDEKNEKEKEKELKKQFAINEKRTKLDEKNAIKNAKIQEKEILKLNKENIDDNITEIQGKNKLLLNRKISQFIILFPEQLKNFKYKKNSSEDELKIILDECSLLVEIGSVDLFVTDSILSTIELTENFTRLSDYDITGLSVLLKQNKDFIKLCKILSIKYSVFNNIPPELQLVLIISCTTLLCLDKNTKNKQIESYLNQTE